MLLTRLSPIAKRTAVPAVGSIRTLVNKATLIGRVGHDAEINDVGEKTVVTFSVATTETRKGEGDDMIQMTQWHRVVSWDQFKNAMLAQKVRKGDVVYIEGPIHYKTYTTKDGSERNITEIALRTFKSLKSKEHQQQQQQQRDE
ncbi:hypothetical protein B0O80DRAFT_492830 [Mortierella sp. GBAus27b]|nr:hypothetical protein BGX31_001276 [Mortierella sp. GBA43]KAI8363713.1 hypothetical protein B0O80DRAFT_492830 [Mortierella sp. GBAus27b]